MKIRSNIRALFARSRCIAIIQFENSEETMNLFVSFSCLVIFALTCSVNCSPTFYSRRVTSKTGGDGYTNTITETDDNGRKEVFRSRSRGVPDQLYFGLDSIGHQQDRIPDLGQRFLPPPPFDSDFHRTGFDFDRIDRDPIKLQMPHFHENVPSFGELSSRFNSLDDPLERDFLSQQRQQLNTYPHVGLPSFGTDSGNDNYSIHKKGFSSSITVDGHKQQKAGATTTINDNGRTATYTVGDRPDVTSRGINYF